MDGRRRAREGWPSVHLSACSLITRYIYIDIYIYIFVRFVATDNRPRHRRPENLNFGTGHTVLPRILSVYRFHTRITLHFARFECFFCQLGLKEKNNIFFDTLVQNLLRIRVEFTRMWNISDYFFVWIRVNLKFLVMEGNCSNKIVDFQLVSSLSCDLNVLFIAEKKFRESYSNFVNENKFKL